MESADFSFETCLSVLQQECTGQATLLRESVLGQGAQASYFNFGSRSSLGGLCQRTLQQPNFVRYINQFLQHVFPAGCWSSFYVSHNEFAHVHQDQNLAGSLNYTISLGAFDGGCIWVQCSQDDFPDLPLVPPPDSTADQSLRGKLISTRRQGLTLQVPLLRSLDGGQVGTDRLYFKQLVQIGRTRVHAPAIVGFSSPRHCTPHLNACGAFTVSRSQHHWSGARLAGP